MSSSVFAINNASVTTAGYVPEGFAPSWGLFWQFLYAGSAVAFQFTGNLLEVDCANSHATEALADLYIDGVLQTDVNVTTTRGYVTFWSGSEGTHTAEFRRKAASSGSHALYFIRDSAFRITSTGTPAISAHPDYGTTHSLDGHTSYIAPETRTLSVTTDKTQFCRPDESFHFKATISKLSCWVYPFTTGNVRFRLGVSTDGGATVAWQSGVSQNFTATSLDRVVISSSLSNASEKDYYLQVTGVPGVNNSLAMWGIEVTGTVNTAAISNHRPIDFVIGDSITRTAETMENEGKGTEYGWGSLVAQRDNHACANYGVANDQISAMASRVVSNLGELVRTPDRLLCNGGRNDQFAVVATSTTKANWKTLINNMLSTVATVPLYAACMTYTNSSANNATDDGYVQAELDGIAEIASARVTGIDLRTTLVQSSTDFADGAHPNSSGNQKIANAVIAAFAPSLIPHRLVNGGRWRAGSRTALSY